MRSPTSTSARASTPTTARARGRLSIAVTRGLLLDLLATGDRQGTDAAMAQWIALNEAALDSDAV